MKISSEAYDILKGIAQYLLPALGTLYFALASIWNLPYATEIIGTITAVDTFLGVMLGISTNTYNNDILTKKIAELEKANQQPKLLP
jgi:hypothetical protein